jgi:hypothetical protein
MVNPGIHAEMANLIHREKEIEEKLDELEKEVPVWKKRVKLATDKGMTDLAAEAQERFDMLDAKAKKLAAELDSIQQQKDMLRYEARRPSGREVERAEAMVESVRLAGLVDPDEAALDREFKELAAKKAADDMVLDFGDDD